MAGKGELEAFGATSHWDDLRADKRGPRVYSAGQEGGYGRMGLPLPRRITLSEAPSGPLDGRSRLAEGMGLIPALIEREGLYLWLDEASGKLRPCEVKRCWKLSCLIVLLNGKAELKVANNTLFYFPD